MKIHKLLLVALTLATLSSRAEAAGTPATAIFVRADATTQGQWNAAYGSEGFSIAGDLNSMPTYGVPSLSGQSLFVWATSSTDVRDLKKASNPSTRVGGQWTTIDSMTLNTNIANQAQHQIALYCRDWDSRLRRQSISVIDQNNHMLDTQTLPPDFHGGVYMVWLVQGNVRFRINNLAGPSTNATVCGVFFGAAAGAQFGTSIGISPTTSTRFGGQQQQFSAIIRGFPDANVKWTMSPAGLGTLSSTGLYAAPAVIGAAGNVIVTAVSAVDATKSASATVFLQPVSLSVTPQGRTLSVSQTLQFSANVLGASNAAVSWSLSPVGFGSISPGGLYTAPSSNSIATMATVTATSVADASRSATSSFTVTPAPTQVSTVLLPIEVMGSNGSTQSVQVTVPGAAKLNSNKIQLRVHGLDYENKIAVQVNQSGWISINSNTATLFGLAGNYGGIGGGFSTISLTLDLPEGSLNYGQNTIQFQFVATDGFSSGFRILSFNLLNPDGSSMLPPSTFVNDDPNTWQAPSQLASDIAAGKALWQGAAITVPNGTSAKATLAHCGDCHTQDGRDLKYFNYSNFAIRTRAVFHGLTGPQGDQIVSYIRSLNVPNPGRPWNPPYQPGLGLDSKPVSEWAAGAGIDAVLSSDAEMLPYVVPTLTAADFDPSGPTKARETPIAFQLPDWNRWLPRIHPLDAWGATFTGSNLFSQYQQLVNALKPGDAGTYAAQQYKLNDWSSTKNDFKATVPSPDFTSAVGATQMYSLNQWQLVKMWELNQQFGLEGMAPAISGTLAEPRAWLSNIPFQTSPSISKIPPGSPGIGNGTVTTFNYLSFMWYYTQLILNDGNKHQICTNPIDWGYFYGFVGGMTTESSPQAMLLLSMLQNALKVSNNGIGPQVGCVFGWNPMVNDPSRLVSVSLAKIWSGLPASTTSALVNAYVNAWFSVIRNFTPQQLYAGGYTTAIEPVVLGFSEGNMVTRFVFMIPQLRFLGLNVATSQSIADWASRVWPSVNWTSVQNSVCSRGTDGLVRCTM